MLCAVLQLRCLGTTGTRMLAKLRSIPRNGFLVLVIVLATAIAPTQKTSHGWTMIAQQRSEADGLLRLTEAVLAPSSRFSGDQRSSVRIRTGELPDGLPLVMPVPPMARVLGSASYSTEGRAVRIDAIIEVSADTTEIRAFYEQVLGDQGWTLLRGFGDSLRLMAKPEIEDHKEVTRETTQALITTLEVTIYPQQPAPSIVHLRLARSTEGLLSIYDLLPPLSLPSDVEANGFARNFTSTVGQMATDAFVDTERDASELVALLGEQLAAGGWEQLDAVADGSVPWSRWRSPQYGDWEVLLIGRQWPSDGHRALSLRAESRNAAAELAELTTLRVEPPLGASPEPLSEAERTLFPTLAPWLLVAGYGAIVGTSRPGDRLEATLLPEEIPGDLPGDLPLPPNTSIVGSVRYAYRGRPFQTRVVLDIPGTAADILGYYRQSLASQGWQPPSTNVNPPGFWPLELSNRETFCGSAGPPWFSIDVLDSPQGSNRVHINVDHAVAGPCDPQRSRATLIGGQLPSLRLPPATQVSMGRFGGVDYRNSRRAEVKVTSDWSAARLQAYLAAQLASAGWEPDATGGNATLAWSTWRVPDDLTPQGTLTVADWPAAGQQLLTVQLYPPGEDRFRRSVEPDSEP